MRCLTDKLLLFTGSVGLFLFTDTDLTAATIIYVILSLCLTLVLSYLNYDAHISTHFKVDIRYQGLMLLYLAACFFLPQLGFWLPALIYEILFTRNPLLYLLCLPAGILFGQSIPLFLRFFFLILLAAGILLHLRTMRVLQLEARLKQMRDDSTQFNQMLQQKNKALIEKQDNEIYLATLKERNRIAREIHDNVGHMLSRSILQVGALRAMNKDQTIGTMSDALQTTLSDAMNSIRASVHDLHDDSIDLRASIEALLADYPGCHISFEYDMSSLVPKEIKYCYIAILKEALSNVAKHSNATRLHIIMREHPSLFQLLVEDNGTSISMHTDGIGLENMKDRVDALNGTFTYSYKQGFRIFISIPKKNISKNT